MTARIAQDCLLWIQDCSVDHDETTIGVSDPQVTQVESGSDLSHRRADLRQGQLLQLSSRFVEGVQAELFCEAQLIRDLADELERSHVIDVDSPSICTEKQLVVRCADPREYDSLLCHCADELAFTIEDEELSTLAQNQEEVRELCDDHRADGLLDVDSLLELCVAL